VVRVGTSKGSTISLWLQYIRGISYRGPTERKKEICNLCLGKAVNSLVQASDGKQSDPWFYKVYISMLRHINNKHIIIC
jgi:hypothetical protein